VAHVEEKLEVDGNQELKGVQNPTMQTSTMCPEQGA